MLALSSSEQVDNTPVEKSSHDSPYGETEEQPSLETTTPVTTKKPPQKRKSTSKVINIYIVIMSILNMINYRRDHHQNELETQILCQYQRPVDYLMQ